MSQKIGKTPERQAKRKAEGTKIEQYVAKKLKRLFGSEYDYKINPNEGIDIYLHNGKILNIEVKSARRWIPHTYIKNGKRRIGKRSGRFTVKEDDLYTSDFFVFVVKPVDDELKWDRSGKLTVKYVNSKDLVNFLGKERLERISRSKSKQTKITLEEIRELPNASLNKMR